MEGTYHIYSAEKAIGTVVVKRQGLFYQVACRCTLSREVMFCLILQFNGEEMNLGILTPMNGGFGINTRINCKRIGQGSPLFYIKPRRNTQEPTVIRFAPDEPFAYLSRLQHAYLAKRGSEKWIGFHDEK